MPELPEVETVRLGMQPALTSSVIEAVTINRYDLRVPIPQDFADIFAGQQIKSLIRRGKYILAFIEGGAGFVLHLGMSGRIEIVEAGEAYTPQKHDHVVFQMSGGAQIIFNDPRRFGMLYSTHEETWRNEAPFALMGVEPLGNEFHADELEQKLRGKGASIKSALLDQRVVSGLGNIYVCEALYYAAIHPERKAGSLSRDEIERLTTHIRSVLISAIKAGGSSLRDYKQADGQLGYFQHAFVAYNREGELCSAMREEGDKSKGDKLNDTHVIKRIVQSGRSTFYCEGCQI